MIRKAQDFSDDYLLITDSQVVAEIWASLGKSGWPGSLFVKLEKGEYAEIWVSWYSVPYPWTEYERVA